MSRNIIHLEYHKTPILFFSNTHGILPFPLFSHFSPSHPHPIPKLNFSRPSSRHLIWWHAIEKPVTCLGTSFIEGSRCVELPGKWPLKCTVGVKKRAECDSEGGKGVDNVEFYRQRWLAEFFTVANSQGSWVLEWFNLRQSIAKTILNPFGGMKMEK